MLADLGVTLADLRADPGPGLPTLAEYLPHVIAAARPGARGTYGIYWNRLAAVWGERPLDAIAASDIEAMQRGMAAAARSRRKSRTGRHAGEHVIAAARAIYNRAIYRARGRLAEFDADGPVAAVTARAVSVARRD